MKKDKSVKVYVCYYDYDPYDGAFHPQAVFLSKEKAEAWCKNDPNMEAEYEELVLE